MKIKPDFYLKEADGKYVVAAKGDAVQSFTSSIVLQKTTAFLWKCLEEKKEMNKEQLVNALLDNFDISTVLALNDVDSFFKTLKENGIIEE